MCLIIHKPPQARVPEELLASAAEFNPHGFGLMTFGADGRITLRRRSRTRLPELKRLCREYETAECVIHLRYRTRGTIELENTQPMRITNEICMVHNGTVALEPHSPNRSDTWHLINDYLRPILRNRPETLYERSFENLIRTWAGAHNRAGAAAWLALNPVERQDYRKLGSLAAEVSSKGIARRLSWRIQAGDRSRVLEQAGGSLDAITGDHVFAGARGGDGVAISVVRDTAKYIGMAVATLAAAIDPEVIVLAGSVAAADLMLEPVRLECARRLPPEALADLRVEFSTLGPDAIAAGAARLAQTTLSA